MVSGACPNLIFAPALIECNIAVVTLQSSLIESGDVGEVSRPLGIAVVGGLPLSQMPTLYITPIFYICMEKLRHAFSRKFPPPDALLDEAA